MPGNPLEKRAYTFSLESEHLFAIKLLLQFYPYLNQRDKSQLEVFLRTPFKTLDVKECDEIIKKTNSIFEAIDGPPGVKESFKKITFLLREFRLSQNLSMTEDSTKQSFREDMEHLMHLRICLKCLFLNKDDSIKQFILSQKLDKEYEEQIKLFAAELQVWQQKLQSLAREAKLKNERSEKLKRLANYIENSQVLDAQKLIAEIKQVSPDYDFNLPIEGKTLFEHAQTKGFFSSRIYFLLFNAGVKLPATLNPTCFIRLLRDAIFLDDIETFQKLLIEAKKNKDFNVNLPDLANHRLIQHAVMFGKPAFLKMLLEEDSIDLTVKMPGTHSTILDLSLKNNTDSLRISQSNYPVVNKVNVENATLLLQHIAAKGLSKQFNLNKLLKDAINIPSLQLCEQLLKMGADPNYEFEPNLTPIIHAIMYLKERAGGADSASYSIKGQEELIKIINVLIRSGANLKLTFGRQASGDTRSVLALLANSFRMSDWHFFDLPAVVKEDWQLLKTINLAAHRNELGNLYTSHEVKMDEEASVLLTQSRLPMSVVDAHLMAIKGYKIRLEGNRQGITGEEIVHSYNNVFMNDADCLKKLETLINEIFLEAGKRSHSPDDHQLLAALVQANVSSFGQVERQSELKQALDLSGISVIPTLTSTKKPGDHAITYLFHDDLCVRINCGGTASPRDPFSTGGFSIYKIKDKKKFQDQWAPRFINSMKVPFDDKELTGAFLKDCCDVRPIAHIPMNKQKVGNCTWKSSEVGIRAIIYMNIYKIFKENNSNITDNECFTAAEKYSELWLQLFILCDRKYALKQCSAPSVRKAIPPVLFKGIEQGYVEVAKKFDALYEKFQNETEGVVYRRADVRAC